MPITENTRKNIYNKLRKTLEKYSPPMVASPANSPHGFSLMGNKPVPYGYDKKIIPGMFFAAIAHRKDSVTFHFFPIYMNTKLGEEAPNLIKCLKGKTCFHFKKEEQVNEKELNALLKSGVKAWKKAGYMK